MKYEDVIEMGKLLTTIERCKEKLRETQMKAIGMLRFVGYPEAMTDNLEKLLKEVVDQNEDRLYQETLVESQRELSRVADTKNKTLKRAMDKAKELGLDFRSRPQVWFGTTDDQTVRIVGVSSQDEHGNMRALIWNRGGSWSDNGGTHYTESWLEIRTVRYDHKDRLIYGSAGRLGKGCTDIIRGGKLTVPRLTLVKDQIEVFIPGFQPTLMPWEYTLIYPSK